MLPHRVINYDVVGVYMMMMMMTMMMMMNHISWKLQPHSDQNFTSTVL